MFHSVSQTISTSQYDYLIQKVVAFHEQKDGLESLLFMTEWWRSDTKSSSFSRVKYQIPASPASDCGILQWLLFVNVNGMYEWFENPLKKRNSIKM